MTALQAKWLLTALVGGAGCGLAGFLLISLNLPFMGVCLAHAALAGAVLAHFLGTPVVGTALAFSLGVAALVGPLADRTRTHANTVMSILFSLTLGLAFLGIGLLQDQRSELLGLMWGNLLLVRWAEHKRGVVESVLRQQRQRLRIHLEDLLSFKLRDGDVIAG